MWTCDCWDKNKFYISTHTHFYFIFEFVMANPMYALLGLVVRKLISTNPGLKVNQGFNTLV